MLYLSLAKKQAISFLTHIFSNSTVQPLQINFTALAPKLQIADIDGKRKIFDPIRKKWLILLPEELCRQLVVVYLLEEKKYSSNRIRVEQQVMVNGRPKRADIIVYDAALKPWLLVECKSPKVKVDFTTFEQAAMYNMVLGVPFVAVTNGIATFICRLDLEAKTYDFLEDFPT